MTSLVYTTHTDFRSFLDFAITDHGDDDILRTSDEESSDCDMLRTSDEESSDDDGDLCKKSADDIKIKHIKADGIHDALDNVCNNKRADNTDNVPDIEEETDDEIPRVNNSLETDSDNMNYSLKSDKVYDKDVINNTKIEYLSYKIDVKVRNESSDTHHVEEEEECNQSVSPIQLSKEQPENTFQEQPKKKTKFYECEICLKRYRELFNLKEHMYLHTGERPYTCEDCGKTFRNKKLCKRHKLTHDLDRPIFTCSICYKLFRTREILKRHSKTHNGIRSSCTKSFSHSQTLKPHNFTKPRSASNGDSRGYFPCEICEKVLKTKVNLSIHMESHTGMQRFECGICNVSFGREADLKRHIYIHTGEKPYKCSLCPKSFRQPGELGRHMAWHRGDYTCKYCQKKYARKDEFQRHVRKHEEALGIQGDTSLQCKYCLIFLATKERLEAHVQNHVRSLENNLSKHTCDACGKQTSTRSNLIRHCRDKHNIDITKSRKEREPIENDIVDDKVVSPRADELDDISSIASNALDKENEKCMTCVFCNKTFSTRKSLNQHVKQQHQSDATEITKQFQCDLCSKMFKSKRTLTEHVNYVHLQKFNFACEYCDKKFPKSRPLKAHIQKHH